MERAERVGSTAEAAGWFGIASPGHAAFAATMVFIGIAGLVQGGFTQTWSGVPKGLPARQVLATVCALASVAAGLGLLWRRSAVPAARALLGLFLAWLLAVRLPLIFFAPKELNTWWSCGDTAVMAAAAWAILVRLGAAGARGRRSAHALYGLAMIPFGIAHFTNLEDTAGLVPAWLPWHTGWAALTGAAFLAAGAAILAGVAARLAATLSALQMGLFTLLIWVPMVAAGPNAFQWSEFVDSVALSAAAWAVAESFRGDRWLAWRPRRPDSSLAR